MGGERIEIDLNRMPSLLVFSVEHANLILVPRSPRRWFGLQGDVHDITRQGSFACCCILTQRASEGSASEPALARRKTCEI